MSEQMAIRPGEFCDEHFSWLCQAGQGKCTTPPTTDRAADGRDGGAR